MLNRNSLINLLETKMYDTDEIVFIHHPITEDIVKCVIKDTRIDKLLLGFDPNSDYYGQPDFWFKKIHVIGKA